MWREKIIALLSLVVGPLSWLCEVQAAERFYVKTFVPTFRAPTSLGASVSTILALRLQTTLRPRPTPNPQNLYFGGGQIEWSRRSIEDTPEAARQVLGETGSDLALWGAVEEYGPGVIVTSNLMVAQRAATLERQKWEIAGKGTKVQIGLPSISYQFSPMIIGNEVVNKYSRPDQIRVCKTRLPTCDGPLLGNPFRAMLLEGEFVLVRQPSGATGWIFLPDLSEAQGEVFDFTAALISYLRGDFEQASRYFANVRDSKAESLVRNDAALLAGVSDLRRGVGIEGIEAARKRNPYSRFAVQALVMARLALAIGAENVQVRDLQMAQARQLLDSYRHLFAANDAWLVPADRLTRSMN
jgi:hypothetical protein